MFSYMYVYEFISSKSLENLRQSVIPRNTINKDPRKNPVIGDFLK